MEQPEIDLDTLESMLAEILIEELAKELETTPEGMSEAAKQHDAEILAALKKVKAERGW